MVELAKGRKGIKEFIGRELRVCKVYEFGCGVQRQRQREEGLDTGSLLDIEK